MTATDRRPLLYAALAAVVVKPHATELALVHALLDSWRGIGFIVIGMLRHGFDLSLVSYQHAARDSDGEPRSPTLSGDHTWWPTPWRAVQEADEADGRDAPSQLNVAPC